MHQKSTMSSGCFVAIRIFVCLLLYWVNKISTRANIQMVNRGDAPCTSNSCKNLIAKCLQLLGISLALIWYHTCRAKGIVSSEYFSEGCLSRTPTVYLAILVQLMLISWKLHNLLSVCQLASTADDWHQLYMYKKGKPIRMMALLPTSQNLFMHILQAIML